MPMHNGETVGDMIVRHRREIMAKEPLKAAEVARRFTPRTIHFQSWPPSERELSALKQSA